MNWAPRSREQAWAQALGEQVATAVQPVREPAWAQALEKQAATATQPEEAARQVWLAQAQPEE